MIFLLDNYDSFTFNLVQYLGELGATCRVARNDAVTPGEILASGAKGLVISPGPCTPKEAGISVPAVKELAGKIPILGVCLGHQSIGAAYGGEIVRAPAVMHGKVSKIRHDGTGVFAGLSDPFEATRYHSLVVRRETLPECLAVTAWTDDALVMGVRHKELPVEGVQFHPESFLTLVGHDLLRNFLKQCGVAATAIVFLAATAFAREVTVRPGESLTSIAARELGDGARAGEIARANGIADPNRLAVGRRLTIDGPAASGAAPSGSRASAQTPVPVSAADAIASARRAAERAEGTVGRESLVGVWDEILAAEALARAGWRADAVARADGARREADRLLGASGRPVIEEARVRASEGPVRVRGSANAAWRDLVGETAMAEGAEAMTSQRGVAQIRLDGLAATLAPNGILALAESRSSAEGPRRAFRLSLGDVRAVATTPASVRFAVGTAAVEFRGPFEAQVSVTREGRYRVGLLSGTGEIRDGAERSLLSAGWEAEGGETQSPGGSGARLVVRSRGGAPPATRLIYPERGAVLDGEEISFSWEPVAGAKSYRFLLRASSGAELDKEVEEAVVSVTNLPEGDFRWEVFAKDAQGGALPGPLPGEFEIRRFATQLTLTSARREEGKIRVEGVAWPGARVRIGPNWWTTAGSEGRFAMEAPAPAAPALVLVGVTAWTEGRTPRVTRALLDVPVLSAAVTGDSLLPLVAWVDTGSVTLFGTSLPSAWRLFSGENFARFSWDVEGKSYWADARVAADLEEPEILDVTTTPTSARPGDVVTIRVRAADEPRGFATGMADEAWIWVEGPGGFEKALTPRGVDGVYEATVSLPNDMPAGILWVRRIQVRDRAGHSRELRAEGLASEVTDPRAEQRRAMRNGLFFGLGVLVGAAF